MAALLQHRGVILAHMWGKSSAEVESIERAFRRLAICLWHLELGVDRIRRMPIDDSTIKTSLRLPRSLHAEIEAAASSLGLTLNAEMLVRLQSNPRGRGADDILKIIEGRDIAVEDGLRKQNAVLWSTVDRAEDALKRVSAAMAKVSGEGDAAVLKRDVEFALELINAITAAR